jgi:hypothetical protein
MPSAAAASQPLEAPKAASSGRPAAAPEIRPELQREAPAAPTEARRAEPSRPSLPDRDEPEVVGSFHDIDLPDGIDLSSLNVKDVHATWEVDGRGRVSSIRFKPTGISEVDDAIRQAIQNSRYRPAVHNGQAVTMSMEHDFRIES